MLWKECSGCGIQYQAMGENPVQCQCMMQLPLSCHMVLHTGQSVNPCWLVFVLPFTEWGSEVPSEPLLRGQSHLLCLAQQRGKVLRRRDQGAVPGVCELLRGHHIIPTSWTHWNLPFQQVKRKLMLGQDVREGSLSCVVLYTNATSLLSLNVHYCNASNTTNMTSF